jgi:hypothetical protein
MLCLFAQSLSVILTHSLLNCVGSVSLGHQDVGNNLPPLPTLTTLVVVKNCVCPYTNSLFGGLLGAKPPDYLALTVLSFRT